MYSEDDIHYALEMTEVILEPDRRIDTFSTTAFEFFLITELMDEVNQVKVRRGRIEANEPRILTPQAIREFEFEGFGEQADDFGRWLSENCGDAPFLKYGFNFKATDVTESLIHESIAIVQDRVMEEVRSAGNPLHCIIKGIEDAWEICLLKFSVEMIQKSHGINIFDFKRRGMI